MKVKNYHPKPQPPSPCDFFDTSIFSDQKEMKRCRQRQRVGQIRTNCCICLVYPNAESERCGSSNKLDVQYMF